VPLRRPRVFANLGLKLLAVAMALFLWVVGRGSSKIEKGFDIPISLQGLPNDLVVVERGADAVNVRVSGTRMALRNFAPERIEYGVDVSGARPGRSDYEVDLSRLVPRGVQIVSRSPSEIPITFERRATRPVRVRADVEGRPAEGYRVTGVDIDPPRVRLTGARSEVLRLSEVVTEMVEVSGATAPLEREVRVLPGAGHVWVEDPGTVKVKVAVEPVPDAGVGVPPVPPAPRRRSG
jgi:YbbR domain-containing protein